MPVYLKWCKEDTFCDEKLVAKCGGCFIQKTPHKRFSKLSSVCNHFDQLLKYRSECGNNMVIIAEFAKFVFRFHIAAYAAIPKACLFIL